MSQKVLVVGGGPAGLMAAIAAARSGAQVMLLEKMAATGRKLLISGAGRCNLTNSAPLEVFAERYFENGRFLYPAFHTFFRPELLELLTKRQLCVIIKENGKIFPASENARDVLTVLLAEASDLQVDIRTHQSIDDCIVEDGRAVGCKAGERSFRADAVILATGGCSYPSTGSTGDGFVWAQKSGHTVVPLRPALVPLIIRNERLNRLKGISLAQCTLQIGQGSRCLAKDAGELLFTHFGLSGPVILRLSRYLDTHTDATCNERPENYWLKLDLAPGHSPDSLVETWRQAIRLAPNQKLQNAVAGRLPARLMHTMIDLAGIRSDQKADQVSVQNLKKLAKQIKCTQLPIDGSRGYKEAMVTTGGISTAQINPRSMESRLVKGLYFAGEIIDIDGDTGGFNLQAAFSTGWLAGCSAARAGTLSIDG